MKKMLVVTLLVLSVATMVLSGCSKTTVVQPAAGAATEAPMATPAAEAPVPATTK